MDVNGNGTSVRYGLWPSPNSISIDWLALAFRRQWRLFAIIACAIFFAAIVATFLIKPRWTATAQISIDLQKSAATQFQQAETSPIPDQAIVDTQVSLAQSEEVARAVVTALNLVNDPELRGEGAADPVSQATANLVDRTSARRVGSTYLIDLSVTTHNPAKAARLANAMAEQYLRYDVSQRVDDAANQSQTLRTQLAKLGAELQRAENAVAQYRSSTGIVTGGGTATATDQQITPFASDLATAEAAATAATSRLSAARAQISRGDIDGVSGILASNSIADLKHQRAEILQKRSEMQIRYGPKYPAWVSITQQIDDLDRQIRDEQQRILHGLEGEAAAANGAASALRGRLNSLLARQAAETRAAVTAQSLERDAEAKRTVYNQLAQTAQQRTQQRQDSATLASIVMPARAPMRPSFPNRPLFGVMGLFLGTIIGLIVILICEGRQSGIRSGTEVETLLGIRPIALVPRVTRAASAESEGAVGPGDYILDAPASEFAETLRSIRQSLASRGDARTIAFCSSLPSEGKTTLAVSFARLCAMSGHRVVLIECDVRRGKVCEFLGIKPAQGIIELLSGKARLDEVVATDTATGLSVVPVAHRGFTQYDIFSDDMMEKLVAALRGQYDYVILDTAPVLAVAETRAIAKSADAAFMVVRWGRTSRHAASAALEMLRDDGIEPFGVLLNMVEPRNGALSPRDAAYYAPQYQAYFNFNQKAG